MTDSEQGWSIEITSSMCHMIWRQHPAKESIVMADIWENMNKYILEKSRSWKTWALS